MDVKTAFINGFLKDELYMMQPEGFIDPKGANKVCKLRRSIYGLVQCYFLSTVLVFPSRGKGDAAK